MAYFNVRSQFAEAGISSQERTAIITRKVRAMTDEELANAGQPRDKRRPGLGLRPMSVSLPSDVLERIERLKGNNWSLSALVDHLLEESLHDPRR
ncbi:hypothetical protein HHS34_005480 [Acidithiobacillus montserratensis]|uniref:Uncharacterized protein n=1 Tax=Acidithiobacillus montserratensis TaxID=2729135 RepID=A0ACD5HID5_9PROT|nr:hypothetical protein [Acidithiobacillus montserratensis]MBU2749211.1 hypothetical protein [Acidithiobacillus montserratensis]